jgi:translation initiation factor eIF-2B subunit delta
VERAREAKASAKAKSKHAGGRLSDHFSHLRPFGKPASLDARSDVGGARPPRGSVNLSVEKQTEHTEHPAVTRLARLYADGTITGGRARCAALLHTLKKVVESFEVPPDETYAHALTARVNAVVQHIQSARPMSVSMGNAVKSLKTHLARMSEEHASARGDAAPVASGNVDHASDFESRRKTMAHLEYFEVEKIEKAGRSIAEHGANEISDGDVVATHGLSHHCFEILKEAKRRGKRFGVAVIDSRPNLEGQTQLRRLRAVGVECTYCQLTGLDHVLRKGKVTKVLLGAAAVLANGAVVSRCGAAVVAASAVEYKIPVLVAAETVKFHERVQLDAVAHNELGDPDLVAFGAAVGLETDGIGSNGHARDNAGGEKNKSGDTTADPSSVLPSAADAGGATSASAGAFASPLAGWRSHERLSVLNLKYDSTPASCVRSIVCESGAVAPTDVPSFLR